MTTTVWPPLLPQKALVQGYTKTFPNNKIETKVESGNVKQRLRFTAAPTQYAVSFQMDMEQKEIFDEFYEDSISYGTEEFEWVVPAQDDETNVAMFRIIGSPKENAIAGRLYTISLVLQQQV